MPQMNGEKQLDKERIKKNVKIFAQVKAFREDRKRSDALC